MRARNLTGLGVVVTGASSGIGAELARQLAAHGCRLVLAARRAERLDALAAELRAGGCAAIAQPTDVTDRGELTRLIASARAHCGEVDVWVSNAGRGLRQQLLATTDDQLLDLLRLHVLATLWAYQGLVPQWLKRGHAGQIVDVCSLGGKAGYRYNGAYSAAKHAQSACGDTLRHELAGTPITITTIYPGPVATEFGAASPDLTGGANAAYVAGARRSRNQLARLLAQPDSPQRVAACIVRAIAHRWPVAYPHALSWLVLALQNFAPSLALRLARPRPQG